MTGKQPGESMEQLCHVQSQRITENLLETIAMPDTLSSLRTKRVTFAA